MNEGAEIPSFPLICHWATDGYPMPAFACKMSTANKEGPWPYYTWDQKRGGIGEGALAKRIYKE